MYQLRKDEEKEVADVDELNATCIENAVKEVLEALHCTQHENNPLQHRVHVCVVCDSVIIGTQAVNCMSKDNLLVHRERLGVELYRKYYGHLHKKLEEQYSIPELPGMLVSPRPRENEDGYAVCSCCYGSIRPSNSKKAPPKFSLANVF